METRRKRSERGDNVREVRERKSVRKREEVRE